MSKTLIIGAGEVGKSLYDVLKTKHEAYIRDTEDFKIDGIEVLNICYPPIKNFVEQTEKYINQYKPKLTIIHSTVPVGTTRKLGKNCVHSPIHGKHPNLSEGILTFTKYIGGVNASSVFAAIDFLGKAGIETMPVSSPETSELSKIFCTTYYGWNIVFAKELEKICEKYNVPFHEVYGWNNHYNTGYDKLGMGQFKRPVLVPIKGEIGGHCVINNCKLIDSSLTNLILDFNKQYKEI